RRDREAPVGLIISVRCARPISAIRFVRRASYDGRMDYTAPRILDVGTEVASCLAAGDEHSAIRIAFRFVEIFDRAPASDRQGLVTVPPRPSGDARYDALLAAVTEYACARK